MRAYPPHEFEGKNRLMTVGHSTPRRFYFSYYPAVPPYDVFFVFTDLRPRMKLRKIHTHQIKPGKTRSLFKRNKTVRIPYFYNSVFVGGYNKSPVPVIMNRVYAIRVVFNRRARIKVFRIVNLRTASRQYNNVFAVRTEFDVVRILFNLIEKRIVFCAPEFYGIIS